jgi:hypothetical protein
VVSWNSGVWFAAAGAGLFLAGLLTALLVQLAYRRLVRAVADQLTKAAPATAPYALEDVLMRTPDEKRSKAHWGAVDVSERVFDLLLAMAEDDQVRAARRDNAILFLEFTRAGGNPKAPWAEIVRWKQSQEQKAASGQ